MQKLKNCYDSKQKTFLFYSFRGITLNILRMTNYRTGKTDIYLMRLNVFSG